MEFFSFETNQEYAKRLRLRRRRRLRQRKTMEGLRLRSDSNGSTKNAFYQGTIVSDAHQGSGDGKIYQTTILDTSGAGRQKKKGHIADSRRSNMSTVSGDYSRMPPLPRRSPKNASIGSKRGVFRSISPENTSGAAKSEGTVLEFADSPGEEQDSLRYSTQSTLSVVAQQNLLYGTDSLGNEGVRGEHLPIGNSVVLPNDLKRREDVPPFIVDDHKAPTNEKEGIQRANLASIGSGILFNLAAPPGPLQPEQAYGFMRSHHPSAGVQYPIQSASAAQIQTNSRMQKKYAPTIEEDEDEDSEGSEEVTPLSERIMDALDISIWLSRDASTDEDGVPYFDASTNWSVAGAVRWLFYNPLYPEFTSLQQFSWAVILGVFMGVYTAGWKLLIEACVEYMWKTLPEKCLAWGVFTELDGMFPLYHYMWIVPSLFGGTLSYIIAVLELPIPTQNDWIHSLHSRGVEESDTFIPLFLISTAGMASGLSLGPELPLVLTAGMIGSWLGVLCRQSMLQARVMNLTAASAAIGGFFGFPMAGALFVLELPHRMGLQYFEALSPATIASIVAVLINRIVINNDVTGMFQYPFLNETLPSHIFKDAVIYGLFGGAFGIFYTLSVKKLKTGVHHLLDTFDALPNDFQEKEDAMPTSSDEGTPLLGDSKILNDKSRSTPQNYSCFRRKFAGMIPHSPTRAAITGALAGFAVGVTCIFFPHIMFWGEAQLQTMIDKGRTPLPVFGREDEPTAALVALSLCMVDKTSNSGFSPGCSLAIIVGKIFVTGLSLGTGIVGGHFWAPLFVGCVASHFFTDVMEYIMAYFETSFSLAQYPCVALLCIMGATHVVTFRAHIAIILILTLTIDAFVPEDSALGQLKVAGDYSAVFPLLTVAVFVALQISRQIVFYEKQRSRGDIQALPEALCEPGKEGKPWVMDYEGKMHTLHESDYDYETGSEDLSYDSRSFALGVVSQDDIEASFQSQSSEFGMTRSSKTISKSDFTMSNSNSPADTSFELSSEHSALRLFAEQEPMASNLGGNLKSLEELLSAPTHEDPSVETNYASGRNSKRSHRRTQSEPFFMENAEQRMGTMGNATLPTLTNLRRSILKRVDSYGEVNQYEPSLMDQVRRRAASVDKRIPR